MVSEYPSTPRPWAEGRSRRAAPRRHRHDPSAPAPAGEEIVTATKQLTSMIIKIAATNIRIGLRAPATRSIRRRIGPYGRIPCDRERRIIACRRGSRRACASPGSESARRPPCPPGRFACFRAGFLRRYYPPLRRSVLNLSVESRRPLRPGSLPFDCHSRAAWRVFVFIWDRPGFRPCILPRLPGAATRPSWNPRTLTVRGRQKPVFMEFTRLRGALGEKDRTCPDTALNARPILRGELGDTEAVDVAALEIGQRGEAVEVGVTPAAARYDQPSRNWRRVWWPCCTLRPSASAIGFLGERQSVRGCRRPARSPAGGSASPAGNGRCVRAPSGGRPRSNARHTSPFRSSADQKIAAPSRECVSNRCSSRAERHRRDGATR